MMKGKRKKLVAWLLAFAVLMSPTTGFQAYAEEGEVQDKVGTNTDINAAADEGETPADSDEPAVAGDPAAPVVNEPAVQDNPSITEAPAEEMGEPEAQDADSEDPAVEDGGLINYLFVGEKALQAPGEENIVVSFGEGDEQLASVRLILAGEDGRQSEIPLTEKKDNNYQFIKTYGKNETGTYRLVAFAYELDGHKKRIDFTKIGISAQFSVDAEAAEGDADCTEEAGISVTALTSDEISDDMTSQIEAVIQEAADEAVEDVNEGAVKLDSSSTEQSYSRAGVSAELTAVTDQAVKLGSYSAPKAYAPASSAVIVLDPGHGGKDNGASANGLVEKDINLKIAQACKAELEKYTGIKVVMTRTTDKEVSLEARVLAARSAGATLFVSIHMNAATSKDAKGAEVYYPNANYNPSVSSDGKTAAQNILNELVDLGLADRGIKFLNSTSDPEDEDDEENSDLFYADGSISDYYSVIRNSKKYGFPGIIVEHAFLSNADDAAKLKKSSFLTDLGKADAQGILKYCQTRTDYSSVYDFSFYTSRYSDIKSAFGNDPSGAWQHFLNNGMSEKRQGSNEFNVDAYMNRYPDLQAAFGTNYPAYYMHYVNYGRKEGRIATVDGNSVNGGTDAAANVKDNTAANTIYGGTDYGDVYDYEYYVNRYGDIAAAFTGDYAGALRHFVQNGMKEGRQAKGTFNVNAYKKAYKDLRDIFKDDLKAYYIHYIEYGKDEGRKASGDEGTSTLPAANPSVGIYAPVYDYEYYINRYSDVKQAFGNNTEKVLQHFINHGMSEGRTGNSTFNVFGYKSRYSDLRAAFGDDLKKYYLHYIKSGKDEGRKCDLVKTTTYQGVDYKLVYDFDYYINKYSDLASAFANDPAGAIKHFIEFGVNEGRQANPSFNVSAYKNNYVDLQKAFGDSNILYLTHYIQLGEREGRNAQSYIYHRIDTAVIGSDNDNVNAYTQSTTNVQQMVKYFLANNPTYPAYYSRNDSKAKTITDFCQIYVDECAAEGIRPEVAFCQAMKETNFLKFGGDVKVEQYNFAGLGATGNQVAGATFDSVEIGIRAHVQHLKAYANKLNLGKACVDPRFQYVTRGSAPYVEWLGQKENPMGGGWATAQGYGYSIINDYMAKLLTY